MTPENVDAAFSMLVKGMEWCGMVGYGRLRGRNNSFWPFAPCFPHVRREGEGEGGRASYE